MPLRCRCGTMKSMSLAGRLSRSISGPGAAQCSRMPAEPTTRSVTPRSAAAVTIATASVCSSSQGSAIVVALTRRRRPAGRSFDRDLVEGQADVDALALAVRLGAEVPGGAGDQRAEGDPRLDRHLGRVDQRARRDGVVPE